MVSEYQSMLQVSVKGVDSSESDWKFISSAIKAIFREIQLLWVEEQLNSSPGVKAWAMISTIKLQEKLSDDFNTHSIDVNELYAHVQQNGVLKVEFKYQMEEMLKKITRVEKIIQNTNKGKRKEKDKNTAVTPL